MARRELCSAFQPSEKGRYSFLLEKATAEASQISSESRPQTGNFLFSHWILSRITNSVIGHQGIRAVLLSCPIRRVLHENRRIEGVELTEGAAIPFDRVISTMPLTSMVRGLSDLPANISNAIAQLRFRNTLLVYLHIDADNLFPDQWLYIHSPDLLVGRVTNFRNWTPELYGTERTTILALEYWANDDEALWNEDDASLICRAEREIRSTGLVGASELLGGHVVRIRRCYPVYARGYKKLLQPVVEYLNTFQGLTAIGRYGSFKYNNQDHSILMGILAAENILEGRQHDLWAINTDYDSYQESATITASGLIYSTGAPSNASATAYANREAACVSVAPMRPTESGSASEWESECPITCREDAQGEIFAPSTGVRKSITPSLMTDNRTSELEMSASEVTTIAATNCNRGPSGSMESDGGSEYRTASAPTPQEFAQS